MGQLILGLALGWQHLDRPACHVVTLLPLSLRQLHCYAFPTDVIKVGWLPIRHSHGSSVHSAEWRLIRAGRLQSTTGMDSRHGVAAIDNWDCVRRSKAGEGNAERVGGVPDQRPVNSNRWVAFVLNFWSVTGIANSVCDLPGKNAQLFTQKRETLVDMDLKVQTTAVLWVKVAEKYKFDCGQN